MQEELSSKEVVPTNLSRIELFFKELDEQKDVESKLKFALQFMELALSSGKQPDFKAFWEARKKCLELFKEPLSQSVRGESWSRFGDLSKEARRLKDLFDEQSDFAAEQIDIAIAAVEKDLEAIGQAVAGMVALLLPQELNSLSDHYDQYEVLQKELNLLNLFATRITALRKELIKTEMRIRIKNKFFDRLSKLGDSVFPRRKELINQISQLFSQDVEEFVKFHFSQSASREPFFVLRKDIQLLQSVAKQLTLSPHAFSDTRLKLSACWDETKEKDKERKEEFEKKREIFKQNATQLIGQIGELTTQLDAGALTSDEVERQLDHMIESMHSMELGRDEIRYVRDQIKGLKNKIHDIHKAQEEERQKQEEVRQRARRELQNAIKQKLEEFVVQAESLSIDQIQEQNGVLVGEIQQLPFNKSEKADLEKLLKPVKNLLREKKERILLTLPEDKRQALEQLKELLKHKKEEREEIEQQIEQLRKLTGSSGMDFVMAMEYDTRMSQEKDKCKKIQLSVKELEHKMEELEFKE